MNVFNKSTLKAFILGLAVLVTGQSMGYPVEITKYTNGEGKDQVTIYTIGDIHKTGKYDKKNVRYIIDLAKQLNATVILENLYSTYIGKNKNARLYIEKVKKTILRDNNDFLGHMINHAKNIKKIHSFDTRQTFAYILTQLQSYERLGAIAKELYALYIDFKTQIDKEQNPILKVWYTECLESIKNEPITGPLFTSYYNEQQQNNIIDLNDTDIGTIIYNKLEPNAFFASPTDDSIYYPKEEILNKMRTYFDGSGASGTLDIKIVQNIYSEIKNGSKNIIIIAGIGHTKKIKDVLGRLNFSSTEYFNSCPDFPKIEKEPIETNLEELCQQGKLPIIIPPSIFTTKRLLIGGVIAATTLAAILYGPGLWKWVKTKFA